MLFRKIRDQLLQADQQFAREHSIPQIVWKNLSRGAGILPESTKAVYVGTKDPKLMTDSEFLPGVQVHEYLEYSVALKPSEIRRITEYLQRKYGQLPGTVQCPSDPSPVPRSA